MLQEDLDESASPSPLRSVVESGHPYNVWTINGDSGREQGVEKSDVAVRLVVLETCTSRLVPKDYQGCIRVAQRLLLP